MSAYWCPEDVGIALFQCRTLHVDDYARGVLPNPAAGPRSLVRTRSNRAVTGLLHCHTDSTALENSVTEISSSAHRTNWRIVGTNSINLRRSGQNLHTVVVNTLLTT